jgi:alpha-tubulin suppressor-like RCC1 family protein
VYSVGNNSFGQLGLRDIDDQSTPQRIYSLQNEKIKNVVCGAHHTIITTGKLIFY